MDRHGGVCCARLCKPWRCVCLVLQGFQWTDIVVCVCCARLCKPWRCVCLVLQGFDWIDMSRVQDRTPWRTVLEIRPPAQEQNLAVVDLFRANDWPSAIMLMPQNAADNQGPSHTTALRLLFVGIFLAVADGVFRFCW